MYEYVTLYKRVRRYSKKLLLGQFIEMPDGWEDYAGAPITIRVDTIVSFSDHKVYLTEDKTDLLKLNGILMRMVTMMKENTENFI